MVNLAQVLGSKIIAEGVETREEYRALRECGVDLMQGYLLAKPLFEELPAFTLPSVREGDCYLQPTATPMKPDTTEGLNDEGSNRLVLIKKKTA
jgi:EAL domain-containing protein (putative c-di-GMP-specific phosphodiesterase class I)